MCLRHTNSGKKSVPCRRLLPALIFTIYLAATTAVVARVVYVNGNLNTDPVPTGASWATALNAVQSGIDAADDGDEVWVAAATYLENIALKSGVALYGGFSGNETNLVERDWTNRLSILDGHQTNSVVIVQRGATNTTRIDGFTIQNGRARSGGGIQCSNASPAIFHNRIIRNVSTMGGGGIGCDGGAPVIAFNTIQGNAAGSAGGGLECLDCSAVIRNNRVIGNFITGTGFAGGGISCAGAGSPLIHDNLIVANWFSSTVTSLGGGGIYSGNSDPSWVANNTLLWNQAPRGGGIYRSSAKVAMVNNIIAYGSSGVSSSFGSLIFSNNCFFANGTNDFSGFANPVGTNGNISADPQFGLNSRFPLFHLPSTSPCRHAGDTDIVQADWEDIDGEARNAGLPADIGADQFSQTAHPLVPSVIRVSPDGDDARDGSSWASAKYTVQSAIDGVSREDGEVWVRSGTYHERLNLRLFVHMYGGFNGTETNRAQRDWKTNLTVLDGEHQGSVLTAQTLFNWNTVDGFLIQNGAATNGGGIYCVGSSPIIANNIITDNAATLTNVSPTFGGGIYFAITSSVVTNNVIRSNRASRGGGIYCGPASAPLIINNRIEGNVATTGRFVLGNPPYGGGGIYADGGSKASIVDNFFFNNVATNTSDATRPGSGGGIGCVTSSTQQILGNTFIGNLASSPLTTDPENGGAICCDVRKAFIINNLIAFGSSGILSLTTNFSPNLRNNCVYGNTTNYLNITDANGISGNISADPQLMAADDFHLGPGSPCINAGDDTILLPAWLDLDGQARRAGAHVDIGADESGSSFPFTLSLLTAQSGGPSMLHLSGEAGRTYIFESSSDLTSWTPFSTNLAATTLIEVPEPPASPSQVRFYRAFVPAP